MGIKGLFPFLQESAPLAVKETDVKAFTGRVIAIDASMCLYQFLVAVRQGEAQSNLSNASGEVTSHIVGFVSRTVKLLELGIKPVYVFDGKPPEIKSQTLAARSDAKKQADADYSAALEAGDAEEIRKASHRTARATPQHNADVQALLRLLGVPVILAPSEAEASCAALCKAGQVHAVATEDMDCLTFGAPVMLKNFFDTESSRSNTKKPVYEIKLPTLLEQLDVQMERFVDFCILCGCDYSERIPGVGPSTSFKLLKSHGSAEAAIESLDPAKRPDLDAGVINIDAARAIFATPEVVDASATAPMLKWDTPDYAGLTTFLVENHSFNEQRVARYVERLKACRSSGSQTRLDSFFKMAAPRAVPESAKFDPFSKRKAPASSSSKADGKKKARTK